MIRIDSNSSNPIYEQIYSEFVRLIVSRVLKPNEKIPSVRELASTLRINKLCSSTSESSRKHTIWIG
ncbi:MAG: GntR family transcriptional regulator [Tissierellales bacterium]|nr:GntR family transcriptional regulator [Tissierellales bacterium]